MKEKTGNQEQEDLELGHKLSELIDLRIMKNEYEKKLKELNSRILTLDREVYSYQPKYI